MKHTLMALAVLGISLLSFGAAPLPPRVTEISGKSQKVKNFEIVLEKKTPLMRFTAQELQNFLQKVTGIKPQIVAKPTGKNIALIPGDSSYAKKAGLDVRKLPAEGYYIRRIGNQIILAGKDSAVDHPASNRWTQPYQRGSLSAAYDFLERFANVRFFFAGPHGTVAPFQGAVTLPEKINILERPDMTHRNYYHGNATLYPGYPASKKAPTGDTLTRIRLRFSENLVNYGHGQCFLNLIERFGDKHPEYFALMTDGRRCKEKDVPHTGHLCYSSNVVEELYQDAKAYLTNQPPSSRGLKIWRGHNRVANAFNIMPQDWLYWCGCEKCKKIAAPGRSLIYSDPAHHKAASNYIWKITSQIANRLKKEGIKGYLTQMAYNPYNVVPDEPIADNILIQVAVKGAGADKEDTALLRAWKEKSNSKSTVWTYFIGKHMSKKIAGVPPMAPRATGDFVDANKDYISGAFFESETDYLIFQYLNYYVLAKKLWNNSLSTEELLNDHHRAMFGKGAPFLKKFYEKLEEAWCKKIIGNVVDTGLGPQVRVPSDLQLWTEIFSPKQMKEFNTLFDKALRAASSDKGAVSRIKFIRQNLFGPLEKEAQKFAANQSARDSWIISCPGSVYLRSYETEVNEVNTKVSVRKDDKALYFTFECEEPEMKFIRADETKRESNKTFYDSDVEIMINPSGDRKNYYQFVVNANGAITDYIWSGRDSDRNWNSSATAQVSRAADSWIVTVRIPLKDLGKLNAKGVPVNFARHRSLKSGAKVKKLSTYYQWSALSGKRGGFHATHNWGILSFDKPKKYLLKEDYSSGKIRSLWRSGDKGRKKSAQISRIDNRVFITEGKSLYFKNIAGMRISSGFELPDMKPSTKYRLTYFLKTKDLKGPKGGAGAFIYFNKTAGKALPTPTVLGTNPWHRLQFEFTTPATTGQGRKPILGLWIWIAPGEAWFDNICIEEIR